MFDLSIPAIVIGALYGLILGVAAGIWFCAFLLVKKNAVSEDKKAVFSYSPRGVEIFNRNMTDDFGSVAPLWNSKKAALLNPSDEANLEYFIRNTDLDYKPAKKKLDLDKVNKSTVNRRK